MSDSGGEPIKQLREELAELRAEVEKLRAEVEAEERAEKPRRKRRKPYLRLIKGGGMVALVSSAVGRYWREAAAVTAVSAAAAGVVVWEQVPAGPGPEQIRVPHSQRTTAPPKLVPSKAPPATRSSQPLSRPFPSMRTSERTRTVAPSATPSAESRAAEDVTPLASPSRLLPSIGVTLPSISLPPPTVLLSLPVSPGTCLVTIGPVATICVPSGR